MRALVQFSTTLSPADRAALAETLGAAETFTGTPAGFA
jgi:uncharacterized membrane protein